MLWRSAVKRSGSGGQTDLAVWGDQHGGPAEVKVPHQRRRDQTAGSQTGVHAREGAMSEERLLDILEILFKMRVSAESP